MVLVIPIAIAQKIVTDPTVLPHALNVKKVPQPGVQDTNLVIAQKVIIAQTVSPRALHARTVPQPGVWDLPLATAL